MSIQLTILYRGIKSEVLLKDSAYLNLIEFCASHGDGGREVPTTPPKFAGGPIVEPVKQDGKIERTKKWLSEHTASEVLNRIGWSNYPDKILLMAAFHEANGGEEAWKNSDMEERFSQAKEPFPGNFARDLKTALTSGNIGAVSSRTYKVGRAGWNKIADAIAELEFPQK